MKASSLWHARYLGLCLLLGIACGPAQDDEPSGAVQARNLVTGEICRFASAEEVPAGYSRCLDDGCAVPPEIACAALGPEVCTLHPNCELTALWCKPELALEVSGSTETSCEYACMATRKRLCEELITERECLAQPACEWEPTLCPACAGCPCPSTCQSKRDPRPPVPPRGACLTNLECSPDEFCQLQEGCGTLGLGSCQARPLVCAALDLPICGCDGRDYGSACEAAAAGVSIAHVGACAAAPPPLPPGNCGSDAGCAHGELCVFGSGCGKLGLGLCQQRPQLCTYEEAPVCGCDGASYDNDCEAYAAGTSVAARGACTVATPNLSR